MLIHFIMLLYSSLLPVVGARTDKCVTGLLLFASMRPMLDSVSFFDGILKVES
jgi:hypothetical protein